jgi:hypothetical protein
MTIANALSRLSLPIAALLLLFSCLAQAIETPIIAIEHLDQHDLVLYIDDQELDHTSAWDPADAPPLAMSEAVAAVRAWAIKRYAQFDDFELHEIAIKHITSREHHKRWFYLVYLDALKDGQIVRSRHAFAAVLFDGKVIPAVEKPHL